MGGDRPRNRSLRPKEHGAYAQLGLPLVAGLAMGRPGVASACLSLAAVAMFLAHEPLLIVLGTRGAWAKSHHGGRALRVALCWMTAALVTGIAGLLLGGEAVARASVLPIILLLLLTPFVLRGAEKTLTGEIVAALTLTAAAVPVAMAGGLQLAPALAVWVAWSTAFTATTAAVRGVIASHKGRRNVWNVAMVIAASAMAACAGIIHSWLCVAGAPLLLASWWLIARPPDARHLNRVGWTLMTTAIVVTVIVVAAVRVQPTLR